MVREAAVKMFCSHEIKIQETPAGNFISLLDGQGVKEEKEKEERRQVH